MNHPVVARSVLPEGPRDAMIRFIAEAPGEVEEALGRPLVGPTGLELRRAMKAAGVPSKPCCDDGCEQCRGLRRVFPEVLLGNTICWRPPNNDYSTVEQSARASCLANHLSPAPKGSITFLVGVHSLEAWDERFTVINGWRGSILVSDAGLVVPLLHPSGIMQGQWQLRPTLAWDIAGGLAAWRRWKSRGVVVELPVPGWPAHGPDLAIDIENDASGAVTMAGFSTDGKIAGTVLARDLRGLQPFMDSCERLYVEKYEKMKAGA